MTVLPTEADIKAAYEPAIQFLKSLRETAAELDGLEPGSKEMADALHLFKKKRVKNFKQIQGLKSPFLNREFALLRSLAIDTTDGKPKFKHLDDLWNADDSTWRGDNALFVRMEVDLLIRQLIEASMDIEFFFRKNTADQTITADNLESQAAATRKEGLLTVIVRSRLSHIPVIPPSIPAIIKRIDKGIELVSIEYHLLVRYVRANIIEQITLRAVQTSSAGDEIAAQSPQVKSVPQSAESVQAAQTLQVSKKPKAKAKKESTNDQLMLSFLMAEHKFESKDFTNEAVPSIKITELGEAQYGGDSGFSKSNVNRFFVDKFGSRKVYKQLCHDKRIESKLRELNGDYTSRSYSQVNEAVVEDKKVCEESRDYDEYGNRGYSYGGLDTEDDES